MKNQLPLNRNVLFGVVLVVLGLVALSFTAFQIPLVHALWPPVLIFLGGYFIWRVFFLDASEALLFMGMLAVQGGVLGLLNGWFSFINVERIWPIFLFMAGVTLIPYGMRKRRFNRPVFIIPAVTFIFMAGIFLPFSLDLIQMSFREFVILWWPLLLVFLGILLLATHWGRNLKDKRKRSDIH